MLVGKIVFQSICDTKIIHVLHGKKSILREGQEVVAGKPGSGALDLAPPYEFQAGFPTTVMFESTKPGGLIVTFYRPKKVTCHPRQPVVIDDKGIERFKVNKIVRALLDKATAAKAMDLNMIAGMDFSDEDRQQFYQLLGYSLSGYSEMPFVAEVDGCQCDIHKSERDKV